MEEIYHTFKPSFVTHHKKKHAEVEFRLGKVHGNRFDSDVGKAQFDRMVVALEKYKGWESIENCEYDVYSGADNFRTTIFEEDDRRESIVKKRLVNKNYKTKGMPFDVRMSISTEVPAEETGDEEYEATFHKKRKSYVRKGLRIDMTEVTGDAQDIDAENSTQYQVEFEIMDPTNTDEGHQFRNHVQKVGDLMKCVS